MPPAPLPINEIQRLRAVCNAGLLAQPDPHTNSIAAVAATLTNCPIALATIVERDSQWFVGRHGIDLFGTPRSQAFCAYTILSDEILVVEDATKDPRFSDNPLVTGPANFRFYAGLPIRDECGTPLGSLCVINTVPQSISAAQRQGLLILADLVSRHLVTLRRTQRAEAALHDRDLLVAQLAEARRAAEAASRAKSEFLANMSHEIRTPLTAILGFADVLLDDGDSSKAPATRLATIETIRTAGQHLLTVINDILDLSKIEADRLLIENLPVQLAPLLAEVDRIIRPRLAGREVALAIQLTTPIPAAILGDPTRLRQILLNLLGNAAKFTHRGRISLSISAAGTPDAQRLIFDIEDTGTGMTPEQAAHLFTPFMQADSSVTRRHGGTGLGLTICRRLAALMHGTVSLVRTAPDVGSCFRVDLPLQPCPGSAFLHVVPAFVPPRPLPPKISTATLAARVLLVEDGPDNRRLISHHLTKAGATVITAEHGQDALRQLDLADANQQPFDLIVSDMQMPVMDGYTLVRHLRAKGSSLPILALTANAMAEDERTCLDAGCDAYQSKPIDKAKLINACASLLAVRQTAARAA
jgi:signal transduction histidine kinase/ActR/RegA family two-component response regulator